MLLRATAIWFVLLLTAVGNGAVRETLLIPRVGDWLGHVVSTLMLAVLIVVIATAAMGWIGPTASEVFTLGLFWLALTIAFEFLAGHSLFHTPWERLFQDYNVAAGRIWLLVLVATLLAPVIAMRLRSHHARRC